MKKNKRVPALPGRQAGGRQAVVLLSGGLDSATALYVAKKSGYRCFCLIFDYGQRHRREIDSAKKISRKAGCAFAVLKINLPWKGSALLEKNIKITGVATSPRHHATRKIPLTYVPGRNIIFLSFALSFAESIKASAIFIGAHTQDYSGYPDCRMEFLRAFTQAAIYGTRAGVEKRRIAIRAPLIHMSKGEIIRLGSRLHVPFDLTWSCYRGDRVPCEECDSCFYRARGFKEAGLKDPLLEK
ncbi:MAG: hypothetical protein AMJ95_14165 [Omnitrophica WOR_2 bacterium SM23_72]|nr:MAG: hypothetical protein AMJ95_14165 [Omnitrophica WOR_2 bacterium SM23_72]